MVRYLLTAAGALALMSGVAFAGTGYTAKSVTVTRSAPHATVYPTPSHRTYYTAPSYRAVTVAPGYNTKKKVTKRFVNARGKVVTKTTVRDGFAGSSVSRSKTVTDPVTGVTRQRTVTRY